MTEVYAFPFRTAANRQQLYDEIAASHPSLLGGRVFCPKCKTFRTVDAAKCLQHGWPRCCGATMSLHNPKPEAGK